MFIFNPYLKLTLDTHIRVSEKTRDKVIALRLPGDSADDVLKRILGEDDPYTWLRGHKERSRKEAQQRARDAYKQKIHGG